MQRIGGKAPRKIDFRLITATNDNLEQMVKAGQFREDLYIPEDGSVAVFTGPERPA